MKKVLFATTALIATAGVAAADVSISGNGYMGVLNLDSSTATDAETQFTSRLRIAFSASGETDTGLSFGGSMRADQATNSASGTAASIFISGAFGKLTMGDIDSAHEAATGDLHGVGYTGSTNMDRGAMGYIGGAHDEGVMYSYSIDGLSVYASAGQPQTASANNESAFGASYTMNGFTVAAGRGEAGNVEQTSVAVRGTVAGFSLAAIMLDNNTNSANEGEVGISVSYKATDALTLSAFSREVDVRTGTDLSYTGIGAAYNLGGGASLKAGFVDGGVDGIKLDAWDIGMTFSF